jgi:hypothetical protein
MGTLLAAASLAASEPDPRGAAAYLLKFSLGETAAEVVAKMGPPRVTADFAPGFRALQFQIGVDDHHEFSHAFVFDRDGLVSITRNTEEAENVDALFPPAETRPHYWPDAARPEYRVRVRTLSGGRYLLAMGVEKAGEKTTQLVLANRAALDAFFPWLAAQLAGGARRGTSR